MPTPVGHSLCGLLLLKEGAPEKPKWRDILFCLFFANAADLDFIAGFLLNAPNRFHHGISHSVGMAVVTGLCVTLVMSMLKKDAAVCTGVAATVFYSTHVFLDLFSLDSSVPFGLPCFWPLTDGYFVSPVSLFTDIQRGDTNESFFVGLFSWHNVYAVLRESFVIAVPFLLFRALRGGPVDRKY